MNALTAHGMQGDVVASDWPPLSVAELEPVVAQYHALGPVRRVAWHSPRPFAASGIVTCAQADVFVKRHHRAVRRAADLEEEHAFIRHLRECGAPVPAVLSRAEGGTVVARGDSVYEMHEMATGADIYRNDASWTPVRSVEHARAMGRALAMLHDASEGFTAPPRDTSVLMADFRHFAGLDPVGSIGQLLARDAALAQAFAGRAWQADIEQNLMPFHAGLMQHLNGVIPLWCHNDFHASNLLWESDGGVAAVIDFGMANRTSAIFDLATTIERNAIAWLRLPSTNNIGHAGLALAIVNGYRELREFSQAKMRALRCLLPLVHVDFAISEMAYFRGITGSPVDVERAYAEFLLGHAAWFHTPEGQHFIDALL
jgi:Ser/Thr protein kinase RdoA (MazF antagonist)